VADTERNQRNLPASAAGEPADLGLTTDLLHEPDVDRLTQIEQHGYDFIHEDGRYLQPRQLFSFYWGANTTIGYMLVGAIAVALGLSYLEAIIVIALGYLGWILIGYSSIAGPRSGMPTMTLTRAPFGVRANRANSVVSWLLLIGSEVLNGVLIVLALLVLAAQLGWSSPGKAGTALFVVIAVSLPALVAIFGHRMMFFVQKVLAIVLTIVFITLAGFSISKVHWGQHATVHGAGPLLGVFLVALALVIANPISFASVSADYPRYLRTNASGRQITWWTVAGCGVTLFLFVLGASIQTASSGVALNPIAGIKVLVPAWFYVVFAICAALGGMANNAICFYSSGLTMQAIGLRLRRWRATLVDCIVSFGIVLYIMLVNTKVQTVFSDYLAFVNVWAGPFLVIWVLDAILRRWHYDPVGIHVNDPRSPYWASHGINVKGIVSLLAGMAVGFLTVNSPVYVGPIANLLWGGDTAWLFPGLVAGLVYWLWAGPELRSAARSRSRDEVAA
jgi:nucleobase:cation symporter-1, NCS1 family